MGSEAVSLPRKPPSSIRLLDHDHSQMLTVDSFIFRIMDALEPASITHD